MKNTIRIKRIKALHHRNRTVENLEIGDEAWVSIDGERAHRVRVCDKDGRYYTVKFQGDYCRYAIFRGWTNSLFLDEVRTTPRLACENMVTF